MTETRKSLHKLEARIAALVEFGAISIGTAKKALTGLAEQAGGKPNLLRPAGDPRNSGYLLRGMPDWKLGIEVEKRWPTLPTPPGHTIVVPREKPLRGPNWTAREHPRGESLALGLHEYGHAADRLQTRYGKALEASKLKLKRAIKLKDTETIERLGPQHMRVILRSEKRANQRVLTQISKHGTPEEVSAWKRLANNQVKEGYRTPWFQSVAERAGARSLGQKKEILRQLPFLRKAFTTLAARLRYEHLSG